MNSKIKKMVVIGGIFVALGFAVLSIRVEKVTVSGNSIYTQEEIEKHIFQSTLYRSSFFLYMKNRITGIDTLPFVQEIQLEWSGRKELKVMVYEKSLIACFHYMGEYIYFDKDGIVLESSVKQIEGVPYVEGIQFNSFAINRKIDMNDKDILDQVLDISQLVQYYKVKIDKVIFDNSGSATLVVNGIKVLLGNKEIYDQQIASVSNVLSTAVEEGLQGRIDMSNFVVGDKIILTQEK